MRLLALTLLLGAPLAAQSTQPTQSATYVYDLNGQRVDWTQAQRGDGRSSQTVRDLNGQRVPIEQVEEKVVKKEGNLVVVERTKKNFDPTGKPLPSDKTVIEIETRPDGSKLEKSTLYRADLNGRLQLAERSVSETRTSGSETVKETAVEIATINGTLEPIQKIVSNTTKDDNSAQESVKIYTRDTNGQFQETNRKTLTVKTTDGKTQEQVDEYESATTGKLRLSGQSVSTIVKNADGTSHKEVDVFGPAAVGQVMSNDGSLKLREKRYYETTVSPDGTTVEVFSIRRPNLTGQHDLGPKVTIAETVTKPE
jgi:hypothetical protein